MNKPTLEQRRSFSPLIEHHKTISRLHGQDPSEFFHFHNLIFGSQELITILH